MPLDIHTCLVNVSAKEMVVAIENELKNHLVFYSTVIQLYNYSTVTLDPRLVKSNSLFTTEVKHKFFAFVCVLALNIICIYYLAFHNFVTLLFRSSNYFTAVCDNYLFKIKLHKLIM